MHFRIRTKLILALLLVSLLPLLAALLVPLYINSSVANTEVKGRLDKARGGLMTHVAKMQEICREFGEGLLADPRFQRLYTEGNPTPSIGSKDRRPTWLLYGINKADAEVRNYILWLLPLSREEFDRWQAMEQQERLFLTHSVRPASGSSTVVSCVGDTVRLPDDRYGWHALLVGIPVWEERNLDGAVEYSQTFVENLAQTFGVNGKLLGERSDQFQQARANLPAEAVANLFEQGRAVYDDQATINRTRCHTWLLPVWRGTTGEVCSVVLFWLPQEPVVAVWSHMKNSLYLGLLGAGLFAILLGLLVSRSFSQPINALHRQVQRLTRGDLEMQVQVKSQDELGELAEAFNDMTTRLKSTLAELRQRNLTIEDQNRHLDRTVRELEGIRVFIESVLHQVRSGVLTIDRKGCVTTLNPVAARLLGLHGLAETLKEGGQGPACREVLADPALLDWIEQVLCGGESIEHREIDLRRPDDSVVPVEVTITPLEAETGVESGDPEGIVATFVDLSSVKSLQERLRRQERMAALGQLTAGVAHEIRNPLSIIKGCAELLRQRFSGHPDEAGLTEDIVQETVRLSRVVHDFLAFARPSEPRLVAGDLNELVERVLAQLPLVQSDVEYEYRLETQADLPRPRFDPDQMKQVMLNLLLNARDAMPQGGRITVRTRQTDEQSVAIEVIDEGIGVEPDQIGQIFNPFFTTKDFGTGLGLSIVHMIVEQHHGTIHVQSRPGLGSTFGVVLPVPDGAEREVVEPLIIPSRQVT